MNPVNNPSKRHFHKHKNCIKIQYQILPDNSCSEFETLVQELEEALEEHLTIATSEVGVSGTNVGPGFCGVGSSSRRTTVGIGLWSGSVRRFLDWIRWRGVESIA